MHLVFFLKECWDKDNEFIATMLHLIMIFQNLYLIVKEDII